MYKKGHFSPYRKVRKTVQEGDRKPVRRQVGEKERKKKKGSDFVKFDRRWSRGPMKNCFGTVWLMTPRCT